VGFGIRVPGVRISTRGVRVGPRMANVRVSYKGRVSASAGPRIARVSVSGRGVRVGAGLGPLGASAGRGGLRVGGGIGPVFGSVGSGGVGIGVGAGPLWVSARSGRGRARGQSRSSSRAHRTSGGDKIRMSDSYAQYRQDLASSGGTRRNRDELRMAGINAAFSWAVPVLAPMQTFTRPTQPVPSQSDLNRWASNWARQVLSSNGRYKPSLIVIPNPPSKEELRSAAIEQLANDGTKRPVHPILQHGFSNEGLPSRQQVLDWSREKVNSTSGFGKRLFHGRQVKVEIERFANESFLKFDSEHQTWLEQAKIFEDKVTEVAILLRDSTENHRAELQLKRDAEEVEVVKMAVSRGEEQASIRKIIDDTYKLYEQGDPTITTIVLQAAFSDNEGSAAPVGIDDEDLLIVMTAPLVNDVIWPEAFDIKQSITVRKKTKDDRETEYSIFLMCHTLATAKEAFSVATKIQRVKILVLDEKDNDKDPFNRPLLATLQLNRAQAAELPNGFKSMPAVAAGVEAMNSWDQVVRSGNPNAIVQWAEWFEAVGCKPYFDFFEIGLEMLEGFDDCYRSWIDVPRSKRPKFVDFTESATNTSDEVQVLEDPSADDLEVLDLSAEEMNSQDFWMLCALLAENWDSEEVDLPALKEQASAMVACLYPFEETDIDWTTRQPINYSVTE
jgi:hypothetical protein